MTFEEFTAMRGFMERIRKEMQTARQDEAVKAAEKPDRRLSTG